MAGSHSGAMIMAPKRTRVALVAALWHEALVDQLVVGARRALEAAGVPAERVELHRVAGAWELPVAVGWLARGERFDAVLAFGCVIRGDTPHFEFIAGECARGLMQVQLETGVPVSFGVLTTDDEAQAAERADPARLDKGGEAARAAIAMIVLKRTVDA